MERSTRTDSTRPTRSRRRWTPARLQEVRRGIADGTYLTQDKLAAAVDALYMALLADALYKTLLSLDHRAPRSRQRRAG